MPSNSPGIMFLLQLPKRCGFDTLLPTKPWSHSRCRCQMQNLQVLQELSSAALLLHRGSLLAKPNQKALRVYVDFARSFLQFLCGIFNTPFNRWSTAPRSSCGVRFLTEILNKNRRIWGSQIFNVLPTGTAVLPTGSILNWVSMKDKKID